MVGERRAGPGWRGPAFPGPGPHGPLEPWEGGGLGEGARRRRCVHGEGRVGAVRPSASGWAPTPLKGSHRGKGKPDSADRPRAAPGVHRGAERLVRYRPRRRPSPFPQRMGPHRRRRRPVGGQTPVMWRRRFARLLRAQANSSGQRAYELLGTQTGHPAPRVPPWPRRLPSGGVRSLDSRSGLDARPVPINRRLDRSSWGPWPLRARIPPEPTPSGVPPARITVRQHQNPLIPRAEAQARG